MLKDDVKAQPFRFRAQLLSQGHQDTVLAESDLMQIRIKVYAEGGENALHAHTDEDHAFFVLQGQARFYDRDGETLLAGKHQGILLPAGSYYWFQSCGDEPLVLARIRAKGAPQEHPRLDAEGKPMLGKSQENKWVTPMPIPGAFFE
jgi:mannose-6-phosphate isomerase-like protein (cupin superfamily)